MFASRIEQIDETLETTRAALESRTRRLEELEGELAEAKGGAEKAQAAIGERKASHDEAARAAADARHELESARGKLAQAKATLRALRDVDAQLGAGRDSLESRVLSADELSSLVRCRLADVVSAPAELDSLVERLLGETLGAPVVGSGDDVARIMDAARGMSGASGSLTVLNLSEHAPEPVEACGERLVDLLRVSDEARGLVERLLGDIRIVDSPEQAVSAHAKDPSLTYVTLDGVMSLPDGRTQAGASAGAAAGTLERKRRIAELVEQVPALEGGVAELEQRVAQATALVDAAAEELAQAREAASEASGTVSRLRGERDSVNSELGRLESQVSHAENELAQVKSRREAAAERAKSARPRLEELKKSID